MEQEMLDLSAGTASRRSSSGGLAGGSVSAVRERARSESGKENSGFSRPVTRHNRRSERGLRERSESASSADGATSGAAPAADDERVDSPVEFCVTDSALPSDSDHGPWGDQHSSEEELECINGPIHQQQQQPQHQQHLSTSINSAFRFGPGAFGPPGTDSARERIHRRGRTTPQQVEWHFLASKLAVVITKVCARRNVSNLFHQKKLNERPNWSVDNAVVNDAKLVAVVHLMTLSSSSDYTE